MAAVIPIGTTPQKISGTASKQYLIANDPSSLSTVYIGQDSSVSTANYGIKLSPGSSLTWQETSKEVWAVVATGSANITVTYEASAAISGQVFNLASVYPQLIQTKVIPFTATGSGVSVDTFLDTQIIQGFAAVRIQISLNITTAGTGLVGLGQGAYISFEGIQSVSTLTNSITAYQETNSALWSFGNPFGISTLGLSSAIQTYDFPVINTYLTSSWIRYNTGTNETAAQGTITARVYGLYNVVVPQERYQNYTSGTRAPMRGILYQAAPTASVSAADIDSQNGLATLSFAPATTGLTTVTAVLNTYLTPPNTIPLFRGALTTPGTQSAGQTYQINLPNAPLNFAANIAGTGTANYSLIVTKV